MRNSSGVMSLAGYFVIFCVLAAIVGITALWVTHDIRKKEEADRERRPDPK